MTTTQALFNKVVTEVTSAGILLTLKASECDSCDTHEHMEGLEGDAYVVAHFDNDEYEVDYLVPDDTAIKWSKDGNELLVELYEDVDGDCFNCSVDEETGESKHEEDAYCYWGDPYTHTSDSGREAVSKVWDCLSFSFSDEVTVAVVAASFRKYEFDVEFEVGDGCLTVNI